VQILRAPRYGRVAYADGKIFMKFRITAAWEGGKVYPLASLGHPRKFQPVSHLGSVTARHCSSGPRPNFAALNRERHLYLARAAITLGIGPHSSLLFIC